MSFDPFVFTPPPLDDINRAVECAQKAASREAFRIYRSDDRTSSSDYACVVRNARHLTAIHRTLRKMGGPLFDPASPLSPGKRYDLLVRRLDKVKTAREHLENQVGPSAAEIPPALASFNPEYCPPDIENLLDAVGTLSAVAAQRWEDIMNNRAFTSAEERHIEMLALRDLTAIHRTLRRMSALALTEDETPEDLEKELLDEVEAPLPSKSPGSDHGQAGSPSEPGPSHRSPSSYPSHHSSPTETSDACDAYASHSPYPSDSAPSSEISNFKSENPSTPADEESPIATDHPIPEQAPVRALPPIPEIRPVATSRSAGSSSSPSISRKSSHSPVGCGAGFHPAHAPKASLRMSDAEEEQYLREEKERLKDFYPPGHISADDPDYLKLAHSGAGAKKLDNPEPSTLKDSAPAHPTSPTLPGDPSQFSDRESEYDSPPPTESSPRPAPGFPGITLSPNLSSMDSAKAAPPPSPDDSS